MPTKTNKAKAALRHHVTGAIERGEKSPVIEVPARPASVPFLEEHFEAFSNACHNTWNYVAADMPENVRRSEVIEVVLDADRIQRHGYCKHSRPVRFQSYDDWKTFYDTHIEPWIKANYGNAAFKALMKRVFPKERY